MTNTIYELEACIDCLMFIANGEVSEERPNIAAEIERVWPSKEFMLHVGNDEESYFSWQPCEVCDCKLGGDRQTVIWKKWTA